MLEEWDGGMEDRIEGWESHRALSHRAPTMSALGRRGQGPAWVPRYSIANVIYIFLHFLFEVYF